MSNKLSYKEIEALLKQKFNDEDEAKIVYRYFQNHLTSGYERYKKQLTKGEESKSFQVFVKDVIARHQRKMNTATQDFKQSFYKIDAYLLQLVDETIGHFNKSNDSPIASSENVSINDIYTIIATYKRAMQTFKIDIEERDPLRHLCLKAIYRFESGINLIRLSCPDEALIVWRSFLEMVTIIKVIYLNPKLNLASRFFVNKQRALAILGLVPVTSGQMDSLNEQTKSHAAKGSTQYWDLYRFSWVSELMSNDTSSSKLREIAQLSNYDSHYRFTSLFVHERLIKDSNIKIMPLIDYALQLYWRLFDNELRDVVKELFEIAREDTPTKEEKDVRAHLKIDREKFDEMSRLMS